MNKQTEELLKQLPEGWIVLGPQFQNQLNDGDLYINKSAIKRFKRKYGRWARARLWDDVYVVVKR